MPRGGWAIPIPPLQKGTLMKQKPLLLLLPFLCFSCSSPNEKTSTQSEESPKVAVRLLASEQDNVRTLSYKVYPASAPQSVDFSLSFQSGASTSDYLSATKDEAKQIITVTCLKAFSEEASLTISSSSSQQVKASVSINYTKKLTGIKKANPSYWYTTLSSSAALNPTEPSQKAQEFITPVYCDYSKVANPAEKAVYSEKLDIIAPYKNGNAASEYGNIDQSSELLKYGTDGGKIFTYFANLYASFTDAEKKAVNRFKEWGLYRFYDVTVSYNGKQYSESIMHVINFKVASLPTYNPTL